MNYTQLEIDNFNQKDKRISFLSIFSSVCEGYNAGDKDLETLGTLKDLAIELTEELYAKYPIIEEVREGKQTNEQPM